ncbi:uncharacterized protein [Rutidosis leptorrhynchoides]|uniref:uncharacterized protein n=1 Tax=Rutidosis leptorrhynchoides TaxID=125765 RepID=UPI003A9919C7
MPRNNGKAVESSVNRNQLSWLTHWTGTRSETDTHDHLTQFNDRDMKKHMNRGEIASDNFGYSKGIKDVDLTISLNKPSSQSFPFFKIGHEQGKLKTVQPQVSNFNNGFNFENSSSERHLQPTEHVKKYHMFFGESSYSYAGPSDQEHFPISQKPEMPSFFEQNNTPHLKANDPSTSSHRSPASIEGQYKRMQKHIGLGFFPHQTGSHGQCSFQDVRDAEMARMTGGIHSFSRTTHSLLITKQTDVEVFRESQVYRGSRLSTQFNGEAFEDLNYSPPRFTQGQRGVKIQLLDSSDHESRDNVDSVKASLDVQKNESSADTDTMDFGCFKENHLSGVDLSRPNKDTIVESNLPFLPPLTMSKEKDTSRKRKIELPDMNVEISALPAASTSSNKAEPCTSRTQSLDMNTLHLNLDHTSNSNSNECSNTNLHSEPGNRWIKRLKLNSSSSLPYGTKISKLAEPSSNSKLNKFFARGFDKRLGEKSESIVGECSVKSDSSSECKDVMLSHSWIKRWSRNQNQKSLETLDTCKADDPKFANDETQKKQFPSIAAMALMGKAMTGFQQCKFQKKESFVVWNTKTFE